ncbi:type II toxin-antitoxin system VapC family toxin [Candidatus Poriferisocius sp.]|uniref:type II toxin-antitoxin system VapC family toxin n=1 Tax=Candidatus Poriferisocius sp. TaxID=3101276 RepID=UPI003B015C7E
MTAELEGRGILDTNVVLLLPQLTDPDLLPQDSSITAVTLAELSVGPLVASTDTERARRQAHLQQAEADFDVVPFDATAARVFGRVASDLRSAGRKPAARAYDALIAATAIAKQLPLYTANPDDYTAISGLELVPIPHPGSP